MAELTSTFGFGYNQLIVARVQAKNSRGWSELSPTSTSLVYSEVVPMQVQGLSNGVLTTETEINVVWAQLVT
jgi:hypothetical protein